VADHPVGERNTGDEADEVDEAFGFACAERDAGAGFFTLFYLVRGRWRISSSTTSR
jgi:hypothetical protein